MGWTEEDDFDYGFYALIWGEESDLERPPARRLSRRQRRRVRRRIDEAQAAYQLMFDDLVRGAEGRDVAVIAGPLAWAFAEIGRELPAEELDAYCRQAARGERIVLPPLFPRI